MDVGLHDELPAVSFTPKWSVDNLHPSTRISTITKTTNA
jgi:hypothetical protein